MSPYVARLRALVGRDLLLLPSATVLVWDAGGRLLLVRQADSGQWATIGGAIEPDEAPEDAACREAMEEAGIDVVLDRVRAVVGGPDFRMRYANGDETAYVSVVFDARLTGGTPRPDGEEVVEVGWFAPAELPTPMGDFTRALLRRVGL